MPNELDIVRAWHRQHSNGWRAVVNEHRDGTYAGAGEAPVSVDPAVTVGSYHDYDTRESAMRSAERDVSASGHVCDAGCGVWEGPLEF